jgi:hypothetical protein
MSRTLLGEGGRGYDRIGDATGMWACGVEAGVRQWERVGVVVKVLEHLQDDSD